MILKMDNLIYSIEYINANNLIGLKAGQDRQTFLDIWMVVVENRIFARSWGFAEKSWYQTFLQNPTGQIQCGNKIFHIKASPVNTNAQLNEKINKAYLDKYNVGDNAIYAQGIIGPKHIEKTMEFEVIED